MKTIFSLVTQPITQNIAIIRISGPDTFVNINKITKTKVKKETGIELNFIINPNNKTQIIDQVLLLKFINGKSFTGEDVIEIQSHGSLLIVTRILNLLTKLNIVQAQKGEFTKQALLNNKLNLIQAEAINDIINSENEYNLNVNVNKLISKSDFSLIIDLINMLLELKNYLIVNIDYPEYYDIEEKTPQDVKEVLQKIHLKVTTIYNENILIQPKLDAIKLAIVGKPNVGKSSLLNLILDKEKAIVSNLAGTTRDAIDDYFYLDNFKINIIDTAGIRQKTKNKIEQFGINKTLEQIKQANLILWLIDDSKLLDKDDFKVKELIDQENKPFLIIKNKNDLNQKNSLEKSISFSVKKPDLKFLKIEILKLIKINFDNFNLKNIHFIANNRQFVILELILEELKLALNNCNSKEPIDILMFDIDIIINSLNELIGNFVNEDYLNQIFSNFCLGK